MNYQDIRRKTTKVRVGCTTIGGDSPVRIQSMTNTPTLDTDASVEQCRQIALAGADIIRLTAQGVSHARNLQNIHSKLREAGIETPLVADIHFNPAAAFEAALHVEKIRINPGNFADPGRTFKKIDYTDAEYQSELNRLRDKLVPLLDICRQNNTALRIGVNHGSLSDRIMSRYGDTPAGIVESAMEFLRICRSVDFNDVVISIKASNVCVMTQTVRLLVEAMDSENMHYPLHLGVTEAGDGEDARVKSAVGIGSLLVDGIGDTIRVSLSEDPVAEIPVARQILDHIDRLAAAKQAITKKHDFSKTSHASVAQLAAGVDFPFDVQDKQLTYTLTASDSQNPIDDIRQKAIRDIGPTILKISYPETFDIDRLTIAASIDFGTLLLDGIGDGIWIDAPHIDPEKIKSLELSILQATRRRISKTEFIACPSCGRTLFNLPEVLHEVKAATSHLKGLKIAVMGCIVNGPGEMADADYGYIGAAAGCVSLYKGKECIVPNIPQEQAIPALIKLIKDNGDWKDEA